MQLERQGTKPFRAYALRHPDGLQLFFEGLLLQGFAAQEIDQMSKVNSACLLSLK
jgi:hypothetical protein